MNLIFFVGGVFLAVCIIMMVIIRITERKQAEVEDLIEEAKARADERHRVNQEYRKYE